MPDSLRSAAEKALAYICNVNTAEPQEVIDALREALGIDEHYRADELAAPLIKPLQVVAYVEGGVVQAARASAPVSFGVIDMDNLQADATADDIEDIMSAYEDLPFAVL